MNILFLAHLLDSSRMIHIKVHFFIDELTISLVDCLLMHCHSVLVCSDVDCLLLLVMFICILHHSIINFNNLLLFQLHTIIIIQVNI